MVGRTRQVNAGTRLRLQLYEPAAGGGASAVASPDAPPQVYTWWRAGKRELYPSTLHVTLRGVLPPPSVEPGLRSFTALQAVRFLLPSCDLMLLLQHQIITYGVE